MNAVAIAQPAPAQPKLIAPVWHTLLYLLILAGLAVWGAQRHGRHSLQDQHERPRI